MLCGTGTVSCTRELQERTVYLSVAWSRIAIYRVRLHEIPEPPANLAITPMLAIVSIVCRCRSSSFVHKIRLLRRDQGPHFCSASPAALPSLCRITTKLSGRANWRVLAPASLVTVLNNPPQRNVKGQHREISGNPARLPGRDLQGQ